MLERNFFFEEKDRKKLPQIYKVEEFLDSLKIENPYSEEFYPFGTLESALINNIYDSTAFWIAPNFGTRERPIPSILYKSPDCKSILEKRKTILLNKEFDEFLEKSSFQNDTCHSSISYNSFDITQTNQLCRISRFFTNDMSSFFKIEEEVFVSELRKKNLIKVRSESEIKKEIQLRKRQFPGSKIILFIDRNLASYYTKLDLGNLFTEIIVKDFYYTLDQYESAIIAIGQVASAHSFHFFYRINPVPRHINIHILHVMKYTVDILIGEENPIEYCQRFSSLEL